MKLFFKLYSYILLYLLMSCTPDKSQSEVKNINWNQLKNNFANIGFKFQKKTDYLNFLDGLNPDFNSEDAVKIKQVIKDMRASYLEFFSTHGVVFDGPKKRYFLSIINDEFYTQDLDFLYKSLRVTPENAIIKEFSKPIAKYFLLKKVYLKKYIEFAAFEGAINVAFKENKIDQKDYDVFMDNLFEGYRLLDGMKNAEIKRLRKEDLGLGGQNTKYMVDIPWKIMFDLRDSALDSAKK